MTIPESVRDAAERIREMRRQSNEFDGGYPATDEGRTQSLFDHCAVAEWAVENLLNSDDDLPVTGEWLKEIGWEHMLLTDPNLWCHRTTPQITIRFLYGRPRLRFGPTVTEWHEVSASATRGQVRHLVSALKGE